MSQDNPWHDQNDPWNEMPQPRPKGSTQFLPIMWPQGTKPFPTQRNSQQPITSWFADEEGIVLGAPTQRNSQQPITSALPTIMAGEKARRGLGSLKMLFWIVFGIGVLEILKFIWMLL